MRAYDVWNDDTNESLVIFASGIDRAAGLFCEWHANERGDTAASFTVGHRTLRWEFDSETLRKGLMLGTEGIGTMTDGEWRIAQITFSKPFDPP